MKLQYGWIASLAISTTLMAGDGIAMSPGNLESRPNVIFIVSDDMAGSIAAKSGVLRARMPNFDRLARAGVRFADAHCNAPVCGPSRASFLYGYLPSTTGFFGYRQNQRAQDREYKIFRESRNLMELFRGHGYIVAGTGKIDHHYFASDWDKGRFGVEPDFGPWPTAGQSGQPMAHPGLPAPLNTKMWDGFGKLSQTPVFDGHPGGWTCFAGPGRDSLNKPFRYQSADDRDLLPDEKSAGWAARFLAEEHRHPFFLAVGFVKPHTPLYLPDNYIEAYESDAIRLPDPHYPATEPAIARSSLTPDDWGPASYKNLTETEAGSVLPDWVRAYLAATTFMDGQLGKVLAALEKSRYADNTVIVFCSDNGYHLGSKRRVFKNSVWNEATHVPLVIVPHRAATARGTCPTPVSLVDIYPTLVDLCRLSSERRIGESPLDGRSLVPLLRNPGQDENRAPVTAFVAGVKELANKEPGETRDQHIALIDKDWRYIRFSDGSESLWKRQDGRETPVDPHTDERLRATIERFRTFRKRIPPVKANATTHLPQNTKDH